MYVAPATEKFNEASGTIKRPPEKKKKGEIKYRIAETVPASFEYNLDVILYRKKLVNRPKPMKGTLKICN